MEPDLKVSWRSSPIHDAAKPLEWLLGTWKSISGKGSFPTIVPFSYGDKITFTSFGQPLLNYSSLSWHPVEKSPMHLESGFLRIKPGTTDVAFMVSHNIGLTSVEEGVVTKDSLKVKSTQISRMSFGKEPKVTSIDRSFMLIDGKLEVTVFMGTSRTESTQHLKAVYERV